HVVAADVTDGATAALATRASLAQFGGVDVVHYNVGMSEPIAAETVSLEAWRSVFAVNLEGALLCAQAALPTMRAQGSGAFVFISTVASLVSAGYAYASYEASKAALNRLCQTLAVAHAAEGIRANVIVPGLIDTPHARHLMAGRAFEPADFMARRAAAPPMKRQGTPWEVAHAAVFLASDAASYITGAVLPVDGGLTLKTASS
ncbi:MAG: SDR family oxidoreductase, partial [Pseudomonadota bacterium]